MKRQISITDFPVGADVLGALLKKVNAKELTTRSARDVFAQLLTDADSGTDVSLPRIDEIIDEKGLAAVADTGELETIIDAVISRNEKIANDFRGGKQGAIGPLIGQVMGQMKGADPATVRQMLIDRINQ